jgi:NAD-dependent dihydropyrimidine dehydrogenase PreA subunit
MPERKLLVKEELHTHFSIDTEHCIGCGQCIDACPMSILELKDGVCVMTKAYMCLECGTCMRECPEHALTIEGLDEKGTVKDFSPSGDTHG